MQFSIDFKDRKVTLTLGAKSTCLKNLQRPGGPHWLLKASPGGEQTCPGWGREGGGRLEDGRRRTSKGDAQSGRSPILERSWVRPGHREHVVCLGQGVPKLRQPTASGVKWSQAQTQVFGAHW